MEERKIRGKKEERKRDSGRWGRVPPVETSPTGGDGSHRYHFSSGAQKRTTGGRYRWGGTGGGVPVWRYQWGGTGGELPVGSYRWGATGGKYRWGGVTPVGKGHTGGQTYENHDLPKKDSVPVGPFLKSHRWGKRASYSLLQPFVHWFHDGIT